MPPPPRPRRPPGTPGALLHRLTGRRRRAAAAAETAARDLAVLFTDIAGFTELAETLPPQALARFLCRHFALLARCVEGEGGTVARLLGDGLMAFWDARGGGQGGAVAPALRSACAIRGAIEAENRRRAAAGLPPVRLRVGLHAGPSALARLGAAERPTPLGDTVNVAQRLEDAARHLGGGRAVTIVASGAVARAAGGGFRFAPLGDLAVKGRSGRVPAFRLE